MRYFIELAYNGKNYFGWQIQPTAVSVQEILEKTLSTLLRTDLKVVGAGRTDTGVHAKQLFAHFDFEKILDIQELVFKMNSFLPKDISVASIVPVKNEAHARFDATAREYEYIISIQKNPFLQDFAYQLHQKPNVDSMNEAAQLLLKHTDFKCFSKSRTDVKTYKCTISKAIWSEIESQLIFTIQADRFLRNMVRAIVGTLLDVGFEKTSITEFESILKSGDRSQAGASAPAHGLYLTKVEYPKDIFITN